MVMRHVCCYTVGSNLANIFFTLEISHCLLHGAFHLFRAVLDSARLILTLFELDALRRPSNAPVVVYVSKYIHINGRIILKRLFKEWDVGMDWINLPQDTDR
jgi:hypothetical protein